jgi:phospholipid transport system substrate-binding protein
MEALLTPRSLRLRGLILALAVQLLGATGAQAGTPLEDVKGLITEVQTILQTKKSKDERLELIEKATAKRLNFQEMAKRCLDSTWNTLTQTQQGEFVKLFSQLLKASYACNLDNFVKARVDYQGQSNKPDYCEVRTVIIRANDKIPVNFRLQNEPQGWMIYDVVIEGVSTVDNFHSQFQRTIQGSSYNDLVHLLKVRLKAECPN